jgi:proline dehydrogenase
LAKLGERLLYRLAKRWIAGYTLEDAIQDAHNANEKNVRAIINRLGEHTPDVNLIEQYRVEYLKLVDSIRNEKIQGCISVKPSQVGLAFNLSFYKKNLVGIVDKAQEEGEFVWIDMENSPYTENTVQVYRDLLASGRENVGMCLQSNMKRSEKDMHGLLPEGGKIRLVKGAYPETAEVAYKRRADIDANYRRLMMLLFDRAEFFAIGTHDEKMIHEAQELNKNHNKANFEFQMLKGVRDDLKILLQSQGYQVSEYIPYGPEWYNYSKRRIRERKRNILLLLRSITG